MPDSLLASEIRAVIHEEFKQQGFRSRRSNYFIENADIIAVSTLQKSYYGELFYLNIGYILMKPFPTPAAITIVRCNVTARANDLDTPHDERYIDRLLDATRPLGDLNRSESLRDFLRSYVLPALSGADSIAALGPILRRSFGRAVGIDRHAQKVLGALGDAVSSDSVS